MQFDLILSGGRVIDPAQGIDMTGDVGFASGRVAALAPTLPRDNARAVVEVPDRIVTPGLIDLHTHVYWGGTSLGIDPVDLARRSAVTTLVDAGSAGAGTFHGFRRHVIEPSPVRILAYLNISYPGIYAFGRSVMVGESADLRLLEPSECVRVAREHTDLLVGVKVRVGRVTSGGLGVAPMDIAMDAADALGMPMMAHLDSPPPSRHEVVSRLRRGDVLTHCFRPFPNAPIAGDGTPHADIRAARARGVIFDIGHGGGSFGFKSARACLAHGFHPDCISSDAHTLSVDGPAFDLLVTLSKFLCLGMDLSEVIRAATAAPAAAIGRADLGHLAPGATGDASVLELRAGSFDYVDVSDEHITGDCRLMPAGVVRGGAWEPLG